MKCFPIDMSILNRGDCCVLFVSVPTIHYHFDGYSDQPDYLDSTKTADWRSDHRMKKKNIYIRIFISHTD